MKSLPKIDRPNFPVRLFDSYYSLSYSMSKLDEMRRFGSLSELEYKWRRMFWEWSASRLEGRAGKLQDRCYKALGLAGVDRRIERIKRLREAYIRGCYGQWLLP